MRISDWSSDVCSSDLRIADEGVRAALFTKGTDRAVPGDEGHIVPQRPELLGDRIHQIRKIAARKIPAADSPLEQDIADHGELAGRVMEHDMARRVAGTVQDVDFQFAHDDLVDRKSVV